MPRPCTVCQHADRASIDKALVLTEPKYRTIAGQFHVSKSALYRHRCEHLPVMLVQAQRASEQQAGVDAMTELRRCFERINKLFDACDRWLTDPEDESRYDVGPRADDVQVIYWDKGPDGRLITRKASIEALLGRVTAGGIRIESWETKHSDPRELVLKTARQLSTQVELLQKLVDFAGFEERLRALEQTSETDGGDRRWRA